MLTILLIIVALLLVGTLVIQWKILQLKREPLQLDESSILRVEEVTDAANKACKDLGHQVGVARVAIRNAQQATTNANAAVTNLRSLQTRGSKKW